MSRKGRAKSILGWGGPGPHLGALARRGGVFSNFQMACRGSVSNGKSALLGGRRPSPATTSTHATIGRADPAASLRHRPGLPPRPPGGKTPTPRWCRAGLPTDRGSARLRRSSGAVSRRTKHHFHNPSKRRPATARVMTVWRADTCIQRRDHVSLSQEMDTILGAGPQLPWERERRRRRR